MLTLGTACQVFLKVPHSLTVVVIDTLSSSLRGLRLSPKQTLSKELAELISEEPKHLLQ